MSPFSNLLLGKLYWFRCRFHRYIRNDERRIISELEPNTMAVMLARNEDNFTVKVLTSDGRIGWVAYDADEWYSMNWQQEEEATRFSW